MRILSLDPEDALKVAAVQAVDATPESLLMLDSPVAESGADGTGAGAATLFLHTGAHRVCSSAVGSCLELHGRVGRQRHRRGRSHAVPAHGCASCLFQCGRQLSRARAEW